MFLKIKILATQFTVIKVASCDHTCYTVLCAGRWKQESGLTLKSGPEKNAT